MPPTLNEKDFIIFKQNQGGRISGGGKEEGNEYTNVAKATNTAQGFEKNLPMTSNSGENSSIKQQ